MNRRLVAALCKLRGAERAGALVRGRRAIPRIRLRRAKAPKVNEGVGGPTGPFALKSGIPVEEFASQVRAREWFHTFKFDNGVVAEGVDGSHEKTRFLGFPDRFDGLSVLDVGAYDGHYSFEAARRGASDVLATDHFVWTWPGRTFRSNFEFVRDHLGLPVRDMVISVEDLTPEALGGTFDVTLFLGVLYHAPDPLGYFKRVRAVTTKYALIETVVDMMHIERPALGYYPGAYLNDDASNHFGPNMPGLVGLLKDAGFSRVDDLGVWGTTSYVRSVPLLRGRPLSGRAVVRAWV